MHTSCRRSSTPSTTSPSAAPSISSSSLHLRGCFVNMRQFWIFFFRYFAVCEPYKYRVEARPENVNIRVLKYLLIVITISCFINFPRFFETELVSLTLNRTLDTSVETVTILTYEVTELRKNPEYIR